MNVEMPIEDDLRQVLKKLAVKFKPDQISQLPKAGKMLDYVNHAHVTKRLNDCAPDWTYTVDDTFTYSTTGNYWIRGTMTILGVSRVEYGEGKNPLEAVSHFIRRAAMRFGVALDLWAKEDLETSPDDGRSVGGATTPPASGGSDGPPPASGDINPPSAYGEGAVEAVGEDSRETTGGTDPSTVGGGGGSSGVEPPLPPDHVHVWRRSPTMAGTMVCKVEGCMAILKRGAGENA